LSQLFSPPGNNRNKFGGGRPTTPNLSQLCSPGGDNCNEFGVVRGSGADVEGVEGRGSGAEVLGDHGDHDLGGE